MEKKYLLKENGKKWNEINLKRSLDFQWLVISDYIKIKTKKKMPFKKFNDLEINF